MPVVHNKFVSSGTLLARCRLEIFNAKKQIKRETDRLSAWLR